MEKIVEKVLSLKAMYPEAIRLNKPIDKKWISGVENFLSIKLDEQLLSLYDFSNGISFFTYCFVGIHQKVFANLCDVNTALDDMVNEKGKLVSFIVSWEMNILPT